MNTTRNSALYFAKMSVTGLRMAQDTLNSYAREIGHTIEEECPIVIKWPGKHGDVAEFLTGQNMRAWQCPFCHKEFDRW